MCVYVFTALGFYPKEMAKRSILFYVFLNHFPLEIRKYVDCL